MSAPSMVTRAGDSLVVRSVVSGNQLFVDDEDVSHVATPLESTSSMLTPRIVVNDDDGDNNISVVKDLPQCKVKRNYACNVCNYFTQNPRQHLLHLRDVHKEKVKIYDCRDCLYASKHFQKLARHMRIVHGKVDNGIATPDMMGATPVRRIRKRSRRPMDEEYANEEASLIEDEASPSPLLGDHEPDDDDLDQSTNAGNLNNNTSTINNNNNNGKLKGGGNKTSVAPKLKCSLCPFTTRHQGHLTRHERQDHIKTRFFRCVKCNYATHIKARFTKHVKYHSMPMIKCDLCDFRTPYKWNLDRHYKNHNGRGAFKCCACNFTADIKQSLTVHEMNHHVPPVGQAATAGLGVGRRRYKVGASDSNIAPTSSDDIIDPKEETQKSRTDKLLRKLANNRQLEIVASRKIDATDALNSSPPPKKKSRPIPNLIPIQNTSQAALKKLSTPYSPEQAILSPINISQKDLNSLWSKSFLSDFASLLDETSTSHPLTTDLNKFNDIVEITAIKKIDNNSQQTVQKTPTLQTLALGKKNASFFDQLKEKLLTNAKSANENNLTCQGCGHIAKSLSEMASHQKTCGKFTEEKIHEPLASYYGSTRCQYCRQRCKSSSDLFHHMQSCSKVNVNKTQHDKETEPQEFRDDENSNENRAAPHPMENKVFVWNNIPETINETVNDNVMEYDEEINGGTSDGLDLTVNSVDTSSNVSVESSSVQNNASSTSKPVTHGTDADMALAPGCKKVFKCPDCSFWATTASRFHVHIVGHLNKKPFECSLCAYRSNWRWDITKHIRLKSVRDSNHQKARVLMTDETGRRNYSKYNKYLMQMKDTITSPVEKQSSSRKTRSYETQGNDDQALFISLPDSVKSTRLRGDSVNHSGERFVHLGSDEAKKNSLMNIPPLTPMTKKSLWKCKKCNMRSEDRQALIQHVKEHYVQEASEQIEDDQIVENAENGPEDSRPENSNDEASVGRSGGGQAPFRCGHCHQVSNWKHVIQRHCRLKHNGDVRVIIGETSHTSSAMDEQSDDCVVVGDENTEQCPHCPYKSDVAISMNDHLVHHTPNSDAVFKCVTCPYYVEDKKSLFEHLALHGITQPEQYLDRATIDENEKNGLTLSDAPPPVFKRYQCQSCPYVSNSKSQFLYHKQFHRPRGAPFQCDVCNYNVSRRHLLHQHLKVHGIQNQKPKDNDTNNSDIEAVENGDDDELETQHLSEVPLVWLQLDNQFVKTFKCRYCPYTNINKPNIQEHEKFHHLILTGHGNDFKCPDCTFICNGAKGLNLHRKYHQGAFGQIHCLVDLKKSDEEQISQLSKLLNPPLPPEQLQIDLQTNNNKSDDEKERVLYFCDSCPARFLSKKEFLIHMKFHSIRLAFRCICCSYTSRQNAHLLSHIKVHTEEYQDKTKVLETMYPVHENHKKPNTAILMNVPEMNGPAWVVVSTRSADSPHKYEDDIEEQIIVEHTPQKFYQCNICFTKFLKFSALQHHKTFHGSDNPFKCHYCDYAAKTAENLNRHRIVHDETDSEPENIEPKVNKPQPMPVSISGTDLYLQKCEAESNYNENATTSRQVSSLHVDPQFGILMHGSPEFIYPTYMKNGRMKEKRYKCHKCPSAFEKREQYKNHLTLHGSKQRYRCKACDYSVKYYANYVQHTRKHQINDDAQAAKLKSRQNSSTDEQSDDNVENVSFAAKTVLPAASSPRGPLKLSVADRQSLMILQQRRSNNIQNQKPSIPDDKKMYSCPICPYANCRRDSVDNHIKRHISISGYESNYTCTHCDYSVPQSHFLRDHIKIHFTPMKSNKVEAYMVCDKLQLYASEINSADEEKAEANGIVIFQEKNGKYSPAIDDEEDCLVIDESGLDEMVIINAQTGEPISDTNNEIESKEAKESTDELI